MRQIRRIKRAAARSDCLVPVFSYIPTVFRWTPQTTPLASYRIAHSLRFKFATLTFKALHTGRPPYLSDLLQYHESTRSLRSSSTHQLSVPRYNLTFGSRAFRFFAQEFRIHYLSVSVNLSHFLLLDVVYRHFIFSQPIPFSYPPCVEYLRPRALILLRLRRYITHLVTHLVWPHW